MEKSLKEFRDFYLEFLLHFLWRQWAAIGVAGHTETRSKWIIDPEALLLFTCTIGRYDARLFDEVLDWLDVNGNFINIQRLRNILTKEKYAGGKVLSAIAKISTGHSKCLKWKTLLKSGLNEFTNNPTSLFFFKDGKPMVSYGEQDADFNNYGFARGKIELRGHTQPVNITKNTGILVKLRALFGINARCEIILYLLTHKSAHPSLIAREIYYSQKTVQDILVEMIQSGLVRVRTVGREKHYWLDKKKWFEFLKQDNGLLQWMNWPAILSALEIIWIKLNNNKILEYNSLLQSSELRVLMQKVKPRIETSGFAEILSDDRLFPGEDYTGIFIEDIKRLLENIRA